MAKHSKAHPGFSTIMGRIERKEGVSAKTAGAELAASSRHASAKAKRANPKLRKVKG